MGKETISNQRALLRKAGDLLQIEFFMCVLNRGLFLTWQPFRSWWCGTFLMVNVYFGTWCLQHLNQFLCCCFPVPSRTKVCSSLAVPHCLVSLYWMSQRLCRLKNFIVVYSVHTDACRSFSCLEIDPTEELDWWNSVIFFSIVWKAKKSTCSHSEQITLFQNYFWSEHSRCCKWLGKRNVWTFLV